MNRPTDNIIEKVLTGQSSIEEIKWVTEWFSTDEGQLFLASHMDNNYPHLYSTKINSNSQSKLMWRQIQQKTHSTSQRILWKKNALWAAATIIPILFLLSWFIYDINQKIELFSTPVMSEIYVPKGEHTRIIFQDGTSVYLGPDTHLYYPQKFSRKERNIRLKGEAYFDVASNPSWPFLIQLGEVQLKVLGTSFNVMASPKDPKVIVSLDKGKVYMNKLSNNESILITPGVSVIYNKTTGKISTENGKGEKNCYFNWKEGILEFSNTPLSNLLDILSRKYNVDFRVTDSTLHRLTYTMHVECNSLEKILRDLENITPIHFHQKEKIIEVHRK